MSRVRGAQRAALAKRCFAEPDPGFFHSQATGTPAPQRTAPRRATRCAASGERRTSRLKLYPQPSRQLLRELPSDAAGAGAAGGRPFQRLVLEFVFIELDAEMAAITLHHRQVFVLAAAVKAEPES